MSVNIAPLSIMTGKLALVCLDLTQFSNIGFLHELISALLSEVRNRSNGDLIQGQNLQIHMFKLHQKFIVTIITPLLLYNFCDH